MNASKRITLFCLDFRLEWRQPAKGVWWLLIILLLCWSSFYNDSERLTWHFFSYSNNNSDNNVMRCRRTEKMRLTNFNHANPNVDCSVFLIPKFLQTRMKITQNKIMFFGWYRSLFMRSRLYRIGLPGDILTIMFCVHVFIYWPFGAWTSKFKVGFFFMESFI